MWAAGRTLAPSGKSVNGDRATCARTSATCSSPRGGPASGTCPSGELPKRTILQAWQRARAAVFTDEVGASPLTETPYDLRHAAVSTWLNGGVPATDVAEWRGTRSRFCTAFTRSAWTAVRRCFASAWKWL